MPSTWNGATKIWGCPVWIPFLGLNLKDKLYIQPAGPFSDEAGCFPYAAHFHPLKDVGVLGDIYIQTGGAENKIFWKKKVKGVAVWKEIGGNGLSIPHPIHKHLILRGAVCHDYPHWCADVGSTAHDDLYVAAGWFLGDFGPGSSWSKPIDLTFGSELNNQGSSSEPIDLTFETELDKHGSSSEPIDLTE
ncbi:hypothetical protein GALMADRAFT_148404 [Galerina marginata CBS 339.88]|uniref:Uncharacterized protein n=1 Tax=Galerina marginata (strain CBS 339.88) TaxID=685588 RepID=A0A067S4S7_GALM3|nr:hypothetical protein GALMADRAFT_148404 [Galerina marginata CBS 339.88]